MKSFLEFLKEYNKKLKEDAVVAPGSAEAASGGADVVPPGEANGAQNLDVAPPKAMNAVSDNSVLGTCSKKKFEKDGFLGKGDFHVPVNVLSGDVETKILRRV